MQTYKRRLSFQQLQSNENNNIFDFLPEINDYFFTESVRGGLEAIIEKLWPNKNVTIMLPVFVAEGVISPFQKAGASVVFYKLYKNLSPDIQDIKNKLILNPNVNCILVIHYFGFPQELCQVRDICNKHQCILLEDCVHALFSKDSQGNYLGYQGDISFFSFPKTLPVPDGGIFFINNSEIKPLFENIHYHKSRTGFFMVKVHLFYLLLKNLEVKLNYSVCYRMINFFSKAIYFTYYLLLKKSRKPQKISAITLKILKNIDYQHLITQRKNHTREIYQALKPIEHQLFNQVNNPNFMLTGVPVISKDCDILVSELRKNGIECLSYRKSWFYIPENKQSEYMNENYFFQYHFLLPVHENNTEYTKGIQKTIKAIYTDHPFD